MVRQELRDSPITITKTKAASTMGPRRTVARARRMKDSPLISSTVKCQHRERPCPYVSCRHHLLLEVTIGGGLRMNRLVKGERPFLPASERNPDVVRRWIAQAVKHLDSNEPTCVLDVAARGEATLEEVGRIRAVTKEMARQDEVVALRKLRRLCDALRMRT